MLSLENKGINWKIVSSDAEASNAVLNKNSLRFISVYVSVKS